MSSKNPGLSAVGRSSAWPALFYLVPAGKTSRKSQPARDTQASTAQHLVPWVQPQGLPPVGSLLVSRTHCPVHLHSAAFSLL